jgi:hypothetical protein
MSCKSVSGGLKKRVLSPEYHQQAKNCPKHVHILQYSKDGWKTNQGISMRRFVTRGLKIKAFS